MQANKSRIWKIPSVIVFVLVLDATLSLLYLLDFAFEHPSNKVANLLNLDREASIPTWYQSIKLFCIAYLLWNVVRRAPDGPLHARMGLYALPLIFVALSADEVVQVHEWLGRISDVVLQGGTRQGTFFVETGIWMVIVGLPFLACLAAVVWASRSLLPESPRIRTLAAVGLALWLGGALGIEVLSNLVQPSTFMYTLEVVTEEGFELIGQTLLLWTAHLVATDAEGGAFAY